MKEPQRLERNRQRLAECHPAFRRRLARVIARLEDQGLRPRIQDAWRSPQKQLEAFESGHSKLKFGFHNCTGADGAKESLAVDLLDDDSPIAPSTRYLLMLAAAARANGLDTGVLWGLPAVLKAATDAAIGGGDFDAAVKVGWDPAHVEATGITVAEAKAGKRPS